MAIQRLGGFEDNVPQPFSSMLDRFFNESVNSRERLNRFSPQVDTCETEQGFEIEVALPGLKKEDIQLDFQQGRLTISGERKFNKEQKDRRYHVIESQYGSFSRTFHLPDTVQPERIEAMFENGVLHVHVPKDEQKTARRRIEVKDKSTPQTVQLQEESTTQATQEQATSASAKKKQTVAISENGRH